MRVRRAAAVMVAGTVVVNEVGATGLVVSLDERYLAVSRSLVFPGLGLVEWNLPLAILFAGVAVGSLWAWWRLGADWLVAACWLGAAVFTYLLAGESAHPHGAAASAAPLRAAHSLGSVIAVILLVNWARAVVAGVPGLRWLAGLFEGKRPAGMAGLDSASAVERARVASLAAVAQLAGAGAPWHAAAVAALAAARPSRTAGAVARFRFHGDPLRCDNAPLRTALAFHGLLDAPALARFQREGFTSLAGVPATMPGWLLPLDGVLAAVALERLGEKDAAARWQAFFGQRFRANHGHRPARVYTPLAQGVGWAADWEHAAATAIAHARGWLPPDDWHHLRQRALAAAARGSARTPDERLIAAGRLWAALTGDGAALRILGRPSIRRDPIAIAIDGLATVLAADPAALRRPGS